MTTRILLDIDTIAIAGGDPGRKVVTCRKPTNAYTSAHFKTETGAGATMLGADANDQIKVCDKDGGTQANNKNITDIRNIEFDLPEKLAEQLVRYLYFKRAVRQAKTHNFGATFIDIRGLAYEDGNAATTTGVYAPKERFILKGADTLVLKENSFSTTITDLATMRNHL